MKFVTATLGLCWGISRAVGSIIVTEEGAGLGVCVMGDEVVVFFVRGGGVSFRFSSPIFQSIVGLKYHNQL